MSHQVAIEDLLDCAPYRYESPKILLVRVYAPGVDPVEPNPYRFAVVAIIDGSGVCIIKALTQPPGGLKRSDILIGAKALSCYGMVELHWRHEGVEHVFRA
jgi:hypothetical protein